MSVAKQTENASPLSCHLCPDRTVGRMDCAGSIDGQDSWRSDWRRRTPNNTSESSSLWHTEHLAACLRMRQASVGLNSPSANAVRLWRTCSHLIFLQLLSQSQ